MDGSHLTMGDVSIRSIANATPKLLMPSVLTEALPLTSFETH